MRKEFAMVLAYVPMFCILMGLLVGFIRYKKYGTQIRERVEKEFAEKRARGGIYSLFFKRPDKRVTYETFGIPICIGLFIGLLYVMLLFKLL